MYLDPWAITGSEDNSSAADRFPTELRPSLGTIGKVPCDVKTVEYENSQMKPYA
jgi:hypothetical protein